MDRDAAIRALVSTLTDIVNILEPAAGEYDLREATVIYVVARAEAALVRTARVHDDACLTGAIDAA